MVEEEEEEGWDLFVVLDEDVGIPVLDGGMLVRSIIHSSSFVASESDISRDIVVFGTEGCGVVLFCPTNGATLLICRPLCVSTFV